MGALIHCGVMMIKNGRDIEHSRVIEIRYPCMSLSSSTADVEEMPRSYTAMDIDVEDMLCNAHRLNPRVKNVILEGDLHQVWCTSAGSGRKSYLW